MSNEENIPLFPVAAWTVGPVVAYDIVTIKMDFLTNPLQHPNEANPGLRYALTRAQALELAQKILESVHFLETAEPQGAPGPKH